MRASPPQQKRQLPELFRGKAVQLPSMQFLHRLIEVLKNPESVRSDARLHNASVLFFPPARDQATRFHAVQQARDIGIARDEPAADLAAGKGALARAPQDAQDVVLRHGKATRLEQRVDSAGEGIGGPQQADKDLAFQARFRGSGFSCGLGFPFHPAIIVVATSIVARNVGAPGFSPAPSAFLCAT